MDRPTDYRSYDFNARPAVLRFGQDMEKVLRTHDHKGGWKNMSLESLLRRLKEEVEELEQAIGDQNSYQSAYEAVDIANFCMMITDRVREINHERAMQRYDDVMFPGTPLFEKQEEE